ncbi:unnamed protein product [Caenorhabditis angaria]|uniref:RING-type domain-containing protein n=1 Tax=Caenorhabditis angaria TaxID=860376 RepID=A0A9P1INL1_9PELO|nr:unnamed protein product [Caenorhabditis angaria]
MSMYSETFSSTSYEKPERMVPSFIPCDELLGWNLSVVSNPVTKKDEYTYTVCCRASGRHQVPEAPILKETTPPPVLARCDGPCMAEFPSNQLMIVGKCEHLLCKACYGIVKNDDGSYGCSNFYCWVEPRETFQKAKQNYRKIIQKQNSRAHKFKKDGEDLRSSSEACLPQTPIEYDK